MKLCIADINVDVAKKTRTMIEKPGGHAIAIHADVTSEHDCRNVISRYIEQYKRIDILFNNVGMSDGVPHMKNACKA